MRLSISNIAWDVADDAAVASMLASHGIDAIDVAPSKYFPDPAQASAAQITSVRNHWAEQGIAIVGMQSLLFGTSGLNLFGPPEVQHAMLAHLAAVCRVAAGLGATRLVFGSPKNRDRGALSAAEAVDVAQPFFRELGDIAHSHGVVLCIEANPQRYGANFITGTEEAAQLVGLIDHPGIRMQLDIGTIAVNGECIDSLLARHADLVGHVHLSEPDLLPFGDGALDHVQIGAALRHYLPNHVLTVEMLAGKGETALQSVERALQCATRHYRPV
ncbi:sugar phosphate isomerase/epimerase family protein [Chitinimonas sp.]|uniref:sugar phosphate isomerase/epimerase family protein n=1 Tax=Chitinimonas sp. TaxID=1934313 RepID=UPI0035B167DF